MRRPSLTATAYEEAGTIRNHIHSMPASTAVGLSIGILAVAAFLLLLQKADAHDAVPTAAAPQGWSYPFSCCSGYDCREVPDDAIIEGARGYEIRATGELLSYGDTRLKDSPDGAVHWCSVAGADDSRTICLFVPPRGF